VLGDGGPWIWGFSNKNIHDRTRNRGLLRRRRNPTEGQNLPWPKGAATLPTLDFGFMSLIDYV
jgi:hypothetical protein